MVEKSNERTVPPGGGPSFRCILLAEQEMFFSDIFSFRTHFVEYITLRNTLFLQIVSNLTIIIMYSLLFSNISVNEYTFIL